MSFILTSLLDTCLWDDNGGKTPHAMPDENMILTNIKRLVARTNSLVVVANDPNSYDENDAKARDIAKSMRLSGLEFARVTALDYRNRKQAREIISGADLIILSGGKCSCQIRFFRKIKLKKLLKNHPGLTVGISAGSMNLCGIVANFPEETSDLKDKRWLKGMGFYDGIIIPHFDGENVKYQFDCEGVDLIGDYVLPMSRGKEFIGLPNGSYILIDNAGKTELYGAVYTISNGQVTRRQ